MLMLGSFDLGKLGYRRIHPGRHGDVPQLTWPPSADGRWTAVPDAEAPYKTWVVVVRSEDSPKFNGPVLVEWLNVTAGQDWPSNWMATHCVPDPRHR